MCVYNYYYNIIVSEYLSGSPFGTNYQLPLVGLSCSSRANNISQCQLYNQTRYCNHRRTIGIFCKGIDNNNNIMLINCELITIFDTYRTQGAL